MSAPSIVVSTIIIILVCHFSGSHQQPREATRIVPDLREFVSFAVVYKIRTIVDGRTKSIGQIHEFYDRQPGWASIWSEQHHFNRNGTTSGPTSYIYNGNAEFQIPGGAESPHPSKLRLFDDGVERLASRISSDAPVRSVKLLDADRSIERQLLAIENIPEQLNVLDFIGEPCLAEMQQGHLRGLSRLLLVLECRKGELKLQPSSEANPPGGLIVYRADRLKALRRTGNDKAQRYVEHLEVVHVEIETGPPGGASLVVPKRLRLDFGPKVSLQVDLLQFESFDRLLGNLEPSLMRLPLTSSREMGAAIQDQFRSQGDEQWNEQRSFAFIAHLRDTRSHSGALLDPVEFYVAYDGRDGVLARQVSLVDRGQIVEDTWKRHTTRTVYAKQTGLKYHVKHSKSAPTTESNSCLVDSLDVAELKTLDSAGGYELLGLEGALFMGVALVRGIECKVYEKRLHRLPLWLAGSIKFGHTTDGSFVDTREVYLTLYEHSKGQRPIPIELRIDVLSEQGRKEGQQTIETTLTWSVQQFSWTINEDHRKLLDISQDCLLSSANHNHLLKARLDLLMSQVEGNTALASYELIDNRSLRDELFSKLISQLFGVSKLEQLDLEIRSESHRQFHISATLYELGQTNHIESTLIGYATSPPKAQLADKPMSLTAEDCKLEAAHYLSPLSGGHRESAFPQVMGLFCPRSMHCVLLDSNRETSVAGFSASNDESHDEAKCVIFSVTLSPIGAGRRKSKLLQWRDKIADGQAKAELIGSPIELSLGDDRRHTSFTMRLNNIAISVLE